MGDFNKPRRDWPSYDEQGEKHIEGHDFPVVDPSQPPIDEPSTEEVVIEVTEEEVKEEVKEAVEEFDEAKLRVAARKYAKTKKVDIDSAYEMMRNNTVLLEKWANL